MREILTYSCRDKRETRECYKCNKVGHISTNCFSKDTRDKKRR